MRSWVSYSRFKRNRLQELWRNWSIYFWSILEKDRLKMWKVHFCWYSKWRFIRTKIWRDNNFLCVTFGKGNDVVWILSKTGISKRYNDCCCSSQVSDNERQLWLEIGWKHSSRQNTFKDFQDIQFSRASIIGKIGR